MTYARPAVFLDRDGVLVEERGDVTHASQLRLVTTAGFALVVVTNQSAISRVLVSANFVSEMNAWLGARLARAGANIEGFYVRPHHPARVVTELRHVCGCRKPRPGLVVTASRELCLALDRRSVPVGGQQSDVECALAAGVTPALVRTGKGVTCEPEARRIVPDLLVAGDLLEVARALMAHPSGMSP